MVFLSGRRFLQLHNLTGTQVGAYFGYSLAVLDINGDGNDDIVIGAPLHTDLAKSSTLYETGRIYIVYQNDQVISSSSLLRSGEQWYGPGS